MATSHESTKESLSEVLFSWRFVSWDDAIGEGDTIVCLLPLVFSELAGIGGINPSSIETTRIFSTPFFVSFVEKCGDVNGDDKGW